MRRKARLTGALIGALLIIGCTAATAVPVPNPDPCAIQGSVTTAKLAEYQKCRFDRLEKAIPGNQTVTVTPAPVTVTAPPVTVTVTAAPTSAPTTPPTSEPPATTAPTTTAAPTTTSNPPPPADGFPSASDTGVAQCGPLTKVETGGQVVLNEDGQVYENKELTDETIIRVRANNVTIRCVKMNGTGWFGVDNTEIPVTNTLVDQVEISCIDNPQRIGVLLRNGTLSRANVHNCDHMVNAGGDQLTVKDSYCHDLTDKEVVHADCIQTLGGATGLLIEHNALYSRDTSDILLGQEFGDAKDVVIRNNLLGASGSPHPAYLLYLSGTNTIVENNRFTRDFTYGHCTLNTTNPVTWTNNVWHDTGETIPGC